LKSAAIVGLILSANLLLAQSDSLENALTRAHGQLRIPALEALSKKLENTDIKRATHLAEEALSLAKKSEHKTQQLFGWLGHLKRLQSSYDTANQYLEKALAIADERNDTDAAAEYQNELSLLTRAQGKLASAINHALEAWRLAEQANNSKQLGDALYNVGYVHHTQRSYDSALLYFKKSLAVRRNAGDSLSVAMSYNGIGLVYMRLENYDEARRWFMRATILVDTKSNPRLLAMVYNNIGVTFENQKEFEKARDYYQQSLAIKKITDDKRGMASTYGNLADNYNESGNLDEAIRYARLSADLAKQTRSLDYMITAHKILAHTYEKKLNYKLAYENFVIFHDLQDSLFNTNKAREVNELITRYKVEKHEQENEKLKASAALNESVLSTQKVVIIFIAISLGIVLLVLNSIYKLYARSRKLAMELSNQKTEAERINSQLTLTMQENANITNFMVHDLKSPMDKVVGLTELMKREGELNAPQRTYISMVTDVVNQGRKLIDDLLAMGEPQTITVTEFDCVEFLIRLAKEHDFVAARKNIGLKLLLPETPVIIYTDKGLLRRAIDNLLSNAIKFSPENLTVSIILEADQNEISISIADEGPGFTEEDKKLAFQKFKRLSARPTRGEPSTGLGLAIVKNIADQLGATVTLTSATGVGAVLTITLPNIAS
jgi:signal transduction histidine kinase